MNIESTLQLLQIMDLAKQWPQLQALHDRAMAELLEANQKAMEEAKIAAERAARPAHTSTSEPRSFPTSTAEPTGRREI